MRKWYPVSILVSQSQWEDSVNLSLNQSTFKLVSSNSSLTYEIPTHLVKKGWPSCHLGDELSSDIPMKGSVQSFFFLF